VDSKRDLGGLGEDTLSTWCRQVGIIPQPPKKDQYGWDFLLEFPLEPSSLPYDLHPAPIKCWIQVKSTDTSKGNRDVALSNWQHLVNTSYPAFFLALEFDGQDDCQRAYLIHIREDYIYKALQRLREKSLTETKLNESTMSFDYSSDNMLDKLNGHVLKREIEKHVPDGMDSYIKWKSDYKNRVGYENGNHIVSFGKIISPKYEENQDFEDLLVDLQLGRIPNLQFESGEVSEFRFGIASPQTKQAILSGEVHAAPLEPFTKLRLVFAKSDYSSRVDIDGELFVVRNPSKTKGKSEVRSPFVLIEYEFNVTSMGVELQLRDIRLTSPHIEQKYSISQLNEFASLFFLINECIDEKVPIQLRIIQDGGQGDSHILDMNSNNFLQLKERALSEAQNIRHAFTIAKDFNMQDKIKVDVSELMGFGNILNYMSNLIMGEEVGIRLRFDENYSNPLRFIGCHNFVLGNHKVVLVYSAFGNWEVNASKVEGQIGARAYMLDTSNVTLEKKIVLDAQEPSPFNLEKIGQEMRQKYPDDVLVILPFPE
jgi:hypothetical protein